MCQPSAGVRKRKVPPANPPTATSNARLEEKLDDIVSLLRSQAGQGQARSSHYMPQSVPSESNTSSFFGPSPGTEATPSSTAPSAAACPDVVLDTSAGAVHLLRPQSPSSQEFGSPLLNDVSAHWVPMEVAEESLKLFRSSFLPIFPMIYLSQTTSSTELRQQKPFLWLVIMALTTKQSSEKFAMEESILQIISKRILFDHMANLDLLHGLIAFASWSVHPIPILTTRMSC